MRRTVDAKPGPTTMATRCPAVTPRGYVGRALSEPCHGPRADEERRPVGSYVVMPDNEDQIRTLVEQWAHAVHASDMDGVRAGHAQDIVMFDVPPPYEGVRGIDAYRDT